MKTRPALKPGDVCKLHKKYIRRGRFVKQANLTYIVRSVESGDGIEGDSTISAMCVIHNRYYKHGALFQKIRIWRRKLWFTGHNVNDNNGTYAAYATAKAKVISSAPAQPKPGEERCMCGRMKDRGKACYWCGATKIVATEYVQCFCGATKKKGERCQSCGL